MSPNAVPDAMRQEKALSHDMCAQYKIQFDPETNVSVEMLAVLASFRQDWSVHLMRAL